jgi:hypothetical protein
MPYLNRHLCVFCRHGGTGGTSAGQTTYAKSLPPVGLCAGGTGPGWGSVSQLRPSHRGVAIPAQRAPAPLPSTVRAMEKLWIWPTTEVCSAAQIGPDGWLTQPIATLGAAGIAVIAALIAYLGVLKTTSTTRRENRRTEKIAVLSDGMTAVENYARAIFQIARTTDLDNRAQLIFTAERGPHR